MKIVEKKCPNCHANLEFDVGERNVKCPSCRRAYAIEYDKDFVDPEVQVKAKDIQLKILDDFEKSRRFSKVIFVLVFIFATAIIATTVVMAIHGFSEYNETKKRIEQERIEQEAENEKFRQDQDEVEEMIKDQIRKQMQE